MVMRLVRAKESFGRKITQLYSLLNKDSKNTINILERTFFSD